MHHRFGVAAGQLLCACQVEEDAGGLVEGVGLAEFQAGRLVLSCVCQIETLFEARLRLLHRRVVGVGGVGQRGGGAD